MTEDNLILTILIISLCLTIILLAIKNIKPVQTILVNLITLVGYSSWPVYGLIYKSSYGSGLLWWLFLLMLFSIHLIVLLILLIRGSLSKKDHEK